ncbi:hypothetical protein HID58_001369 [Brassica napus]|uniref:Uncharacterized protein n=1 Tax=Brassica napus TaxID=3708 RepID=A0ABQ8EJ52_BRANA|nr:hypothetical protein HID58_001369 [Brassica napus]
MHPESVTVLRELMVLSRLQSPSHYEALSCAVRLLRHVLKFVTEDIKEKIPYVALDYEKEVETAKSSSAIKSILRNKYTAAWMLDVSGSFSPCRLECFLKAPYVAKTEKCKVEEHEKLQQLPGGRSERR